LQGCVELQVVLKQVVVPTQVGSSQ